MQPPVAQIDTRADLHHVQASISVLQQPGDFLRVRELALKFFGKLLDDQISRDADVHSGFVQGVFHNGAPFPFAQNDPDGEFF